MGCRRVRGLLGDYAEGRLDRRRAQHVEAHLRRCARCAEEARMVRSVVGLLAGLERRNLPAERWARMEAAVLREVRVREQAFLWDRVRTWVQALGDAGRGVYVTLVDHGRVAVPAIALVLLAVIGGIYLDRERGESEDMEDMPLYSLYSAEEPREMPSLYSAGPARYVR